MNCDSLVYKVCLKGDMKEVLNILDVIENDDNDYNNGLWGACEGGHIDIINLLITRLDGWQHLYKPNYGLYGACKGGHINIINQMIEIGAGWLNIGLMGACHGGHMNIINLMIEKGATNWNYGLRGACIGGNISAINLMIEKGATDWDSGLRGACNGANTNIVKMMIEKGANNWNAGLIGACIGGNMDIINMMIEKGANCIDFNHIGKEYYIKILRLQLNVSYLNVESGLRKIYTYPKHHDIIFKLLEEGLDISYFNCIDNISTLVGCINMYKGHTLGILYNYLLKELAKEVVKYCLL